MVFKIKTQWLASKKFWKYVKTPVEKLSNNSMVFFSPPVDLHLFFETSIRTDKKNQLELKKKFSYNL